MKNTYKKEERLCSRKSINELFDKGNSFVEFPFKVFWLQCEPGAAYPNRLLISVPKRHFKKAVIRNLIKRRIREAYRKNKESLYNRLSEGNIRFFMALVYINKEVVEFSEIERKIILILSRLIEENDKHPD